MTTIARPDPQVIEFREAMETLFRVAPHIGITFIEVAWERGITASGTRSWGHRHNEQQDSKS